MRHIPINQLHPDPVWLADCGRVLNELRAANPQDRAAIINRYSRLWAAIKDELGRFSNEKCWYCESKQVRSDKAVDHFRPKGSVNECPAHCGYWWLAFEYSNYRYSCTFCNSVRNNGASGGKGDHFPLLNEANRAHDYTDNIGIEEPVLLDPTNSTDPTLLWFDEDGSAISKYPEIRNSQWYRRAEKSIGIYNLNHVDIKEVRQEVCNEVKSQVLDGARYFDDFCADQANASAKLAFDRAVDSLVKMISADAEYSAAARATLLGFRDQEWVESIFQTN